MATFDFTDHNRRACAVLGHMPLPIVVPHNGRYMLAIICERCRHYLL